MKHTKFFNKFLENEVNLNKTRIKILEGRVKTVSEFLSKSLTGYQKRENQGSYAQRTIIKPVNDKEFDADIMIYVDNDDEFDPKDYIDEIYKVLKGNGNYSDKVSRKSRCVTLDYKGDFHLDIVPCVEIDGEKKICNKNTNEFEVTDGTEYKDWLIEKNKYSGTYLKKATKLLKYMRDIKIKFTCKSILLTTLFGERINDYNENFTDLPTALVEICERLDSFLQENKKLPIIKNPVLEEEDLSSRHWDQKKYDNFRERINDYTSKMRKALDEEDHNESVKLWRKVFGDNFGELQKTKSFITPANKPYGEQY